MRWIQKVGDDGKTRLVPADEAAARRDAGGVLVRGSFDAFISPVDGSLIRNHRELEDHNKRNNVVNTAEFGTEHYERKAKEREKLFKGSYTAKEQWRRRAQINEIINTLERGG